MTLAAKTKLGPYEIQSPLGAGGMGEVYRARDTRLNRDVAVKVLPSSFAADTERLQRFAQESRAAAALNHPNILSIYDVGTDAGTPYVVSELLEGETLRDRLRTGALSSTRKAIEYAQQIARGLAAAHEKGIVHRDLKPENIFITHDGRAKILDFGLAKFTRPEAESADAPTVQVATEAGTVMGTAGYMSPEQVRGKPTDARSDIFSFGAILYEMLAGKRAFHGESSADTMSAILKEDPPDLAETNRNIPPALDRIVRHCLEKNPAERFQSARDVAFNLEALTEVSTSTRTGLKAIPEQKTRSRWFVPAIAALLLVVSWIGIYWFARHRIMISKPTFHEITFRNGTILEARFAPDGQSIVYSAAWDGRPQEIFSTRFDSTDSRPIGLPSGQILAISSKGEMAISINLKEFNAWETAGILARVPLAGGAPREVVDKVEAADWTSDGQSLAVIRSRERGGNQLQFPPENVIYDPNSWISHLRFSPNNEFLAIADHIAGGDDGRIVIIDRQGNHKASSSFYGSIEGLAWAPNGEEVWFSAVPAGASRSIYALDLAGKERLIYRAPGGLTIHDINASGKVLMTADKSRMSISAVPPGETRERSLSWFDWSLVTDMSDDGKTIVFSESGEAVGTNYSIYTRNTDGSSAVRLGEGSFGLLSPDGHWVLDVIGTPVKLVLLPTGVGEPRQIVEQNPNLIDAGWYPDGRSIFYSVVTSNHQRRVYKIAINGGTPQPIVSEDRRGILITPDGKSLLTLDSNRQFWLDPLAGGEPQKLTFVENADESVVRLIDGGRSLLVRDRNLPLQITRIDMATGRREPWKQIVPADLAGVQSIPVVRFSADGKSYAYSISRTLSDLFVVDGLR
jgi:serine/threonine protein kinase/Tol biopolymer transport system component